MANGNQLSQAYSILGQATTAEYKRRKKEEREYEKRMRRQQLLGYLAQPLLKTAGEAIAEGVTDIFRSPEEKKYEEFFQSENFLAQKSKQASGYNAAQGIIQEDDKALLDAQGRKHYYTNQRFQRILADFNANYPEEEYKEGVDGVLWNEASKWAETNLPLIDRQVELARLVRSPEEYENVYREGLKPRSLGQIIGGGVKKFFTGKDSQQMRRERIDFIAEKAELRREDLLEARRVLGEDPDITKIVGLADKIKRFEYTKDDWTVLSQKEKIEPITSAGRSFNHRFIERTLKHPETNQQETKLVAIDEAGRRYLEEGLVGSQEELVETEGPFGRTTTTKVTYVYTRQGQKIQKQEVVEVSQPDPIDYFMGATEQETKAALTEFGRLERIMPGRLEGQSFAQTELGRLWVTQGASPDDVKLQGTQQAYKNILGGMSLKNASVLSDKLGVNVDTAMQLGAGITIQHINSSVNPENLIDDGWAFFDRTEFKADDINYIDNNGYNEDKLQRAPSVYSLDAFYAAESRNKSAIMLSGNEFNNIINKAPNEFATEFMDQPQARIAIIRSLERSNPSAFMTDDDGNSYTILDIFMPIHQSLLARGR
jgi:hypothetical protein